MKERDDLIRWLVATQEQIDHVKHHVGEDELPQAVDLMGTIGLQYITLARDMAQVVLNRLSDGEKPTSSFDNVVGSTQRPRIPREEGHGGYL